MKGLLKNNFMGVIENLKAFIPSYYYIWDYCFSYGECVLTKYLFFILLHQYFQYWLFYV